MRFVPAENQIQVKAYSPATKQFLTGPKDQFTIECNFAERFAPHAKPATQPMTASKD